MRICIFLMIFLISSCNRSPEKGFVKIDFEPFDRDKMIQLIKPDKEYAYWEYGRIGNTDDNTTRTVGDLSFRKIIDKPTRGFFKECLFGDCASYIAFVDSGKVKYVTTEKELCTFIGKIDNLGEALLVSNTYDLWFDSNDKRGGSYKKMANGYELYLCNFCDCPKSKESVKVYIDSLGNFKSISKGFYYKSKDCIME